MYKMAPAVEVVNAFTEVPCGTCKVSETRGLLSEPLRAFSWAGHIARQGWDGQTSTPPAG